MIDKEFHWFRRRSKFKFIFKKTSADFDGDIFFCGDWAQRPGPVGLIDGTF